MSTYSFLDVSATIAGPGGTISLGNGAGVAEEGITISLEEDKDKMSIGADGDVMHALIAGKSGSCMVRLLKTSKTNNLLSIMYNAQTVSSALHGLNVILVRDTARGDIASCRSVAFKRHPSVTWSKAGQMLEWEFNAGKIDMLLGTGLPDA